MRSSILAIFAISTGLIAIAYTACNESQAKSSEKLTPAAQVETELAALEDQHKELIASHEKFVKEHAGLMGERADSAHLMMEQQHLRLLEEDAQEVAHRRLLVQHLPAGDTAQAKAVLLQLRQTLARVQSDMTLMSREHREMEETHKAKE